MANTSQKLKDTLMSGQNLKEGLEIAASSAKEGKLQVGAVVRLVVLAISWLNQMAVTFGAYHVPDVSESVVYVIASAITIAVTLYSYWKNNSWTTNAKVADVVFDVLNTSGITTDELFDAIGTIVDTKEAKTDEDSVG